MVFRTNDTAKPEEWFCPIYNRKIDCGLCFEVSNIGDDTLFMPYSLSWQSAGLQNRMPQVRFLHTVPSQRAVRTLPTTEHGRRTVSPNRGFTNRKEFFHHEA